MATVAKIATPQETASYSCDLRRTYLRWAPQEPTQVATVAQIAAPQGTASYSCHPRKTYLRWAPPGAHASGDSCADRSPPGDGEL